ncbi:Cobyrinate a,c-diamide synthase [Hyella patelloides LEGE 07179]|uniref:Cobyrinate a,c-diamide synthase n=1 Tax=Hyella patelloides LEGE 07179 TaxID=945734 RepID=A0A563VP03_9CYAN|nr:cobyrinate a,c-diamide synthase [Hyella patelloides]VEP13198.1 Cobyrinate a,c-diamide synthase [Hyella patelloides LEGE 07179]
MALIIAGERSGVGKTTITLSILAFLAQQKNKIVQGFKVGPDYIDPMFHTAITGRSCRNLDSVLTSPDYVRSCFALHSSSADYVVVEGVMGLFDGVKLYSETDYASTAHVARLLAIPVLLVLDCSRLSGSIAAIAHGFKTLDPRITIAGVVLNRVASDRHLELLEDALNNIKMPILGVIRRHSEITIPDRHLGLIPTAELPAITQVFNKLAHIAKTAFNWDKLLPLLRATTDNPQMYGRRGNRPNNQQPTINKPLKIAIARDRAFNFYYQDNLDILRQLGAELSFWSPLTAKSLPPDVAGFYFGGGFPEMFAEELAANKPVREQLKQSIVQNIPVYAECGGLMYLCDRLIDLESKIWDMVGFIPTTATMTSRLTLGYRQAFPLNSSSLIPTSSNSPTFIWGHEFHRSELTTIPSQPLWQIKGCNSQSKMAIEGWQIKNVHASYVHLHFGKTKFLLKRWLDGCRDYKNQLA